MYYLALRLDCRRLAQGYVLSRRLCALRHQHTLVLSFIIAPTGADMVNHLPEDQAARVPFLQTGFEASQALLIQ